MLSFTKLEYLKYNSMLYFYPKYHNRNLLIEFPFSFKEWRPHKKTQNKIKGSFFIIFTKL